MPEILNLAVIQVGPFQFLGAIIATWAVFMLCTTMYFKVFNEDSRGH